MMWTLLPTVLDSLGKGGDNKVPAPRSNFHLNDEKKLSEDVRNAGFVNIKSFYTPCNECFIKPDEMWKFLPNA